MSKHADKSKRCTANHPYRIVVADDHPLVRTGVLVTLAGHDAYQVVGEAHNAEEAYLRVSQLRPDLLVLDLEMDGRPPEELINDCRRICPELRVLILSAHTHSKYLAPLRGAGISGFVLKDEAPDNLLQAVRVIEQGSTWFSHAIIQQVFALSETDRQATPTRLTPRERQILDLMLLGKDNRTIAEELSVSKQTVRRYATVIYEKLGVDNRIQAIVELSPSLANAIK